MRVAGLNTDCNFLTRAFPLCLAVFLLHLLTGCATMTVEECNVADWRAQGSTDARSNYPTDRLKRHLMSCKHADVMVDEAAYLGGYEEGARAFCIPKNAFEHGRAGYRVRTDCPDDVYRWVRAAFLAGHGIYNAEREIRNLRREISRLGSDIYDARSDLEKAATEAEKAALKRVIASLRSAEASSKNTLSTLERNFDAIEAAGYIEYNRVLESFEKNRV